MTDKPLIAALLLTVALLLAASLLIGSVWLPPASLFGGPPDRHHLALLIVGQLRLPRALLGAIAGAVLGLAGAVLQGLTRNPLAEPGLLGVSAGAALGAVLALYFGLSDLVPLAGPLFGLLGALAASLLTFGLGRNGGAAALVLAGAAVSGLAAALLALALNLAPSPYAAYEIMSWLMGSLADRSWPQILLVAPFAAAGAACLMLTGRGLDALSLGEDQASSLGISLTRLQALAIGGTALAVGAVTAETGAIGFIGLVAPHLIRPLVGHQPRRLLLPAALAGAALLLLADIAARLIPTTTELKLGVITSLIGTPFFFWLVARLRRDRP